MTDAPLSIKAIMDEYHSAIYGDAEERAAARRARAERERAGRMAQQGGDLWRTRRSAPMGDGLFDVVFENPLHGRFKDLPSVARMLRERPDRVKRIDTSYCHFDGFEYNKPTVFITTLTDLKLPPPCPKTPCAAVRAGELHAHHVSECDAALKNAIPTGITDAIVDAWLAKHAGTSRAAPRAFVFVDTFAGYGSVHTRVRERHPNVIVYANDIVDRGQEGLFDLSADSPFTLGSLLAMAMAKRFPSSIDGMAAHPEGAIGWAKAQKIAVLFHVSTPCETYSTQALGVHRVAGSATPTSAAARKADDMNDALMVWVERFVLVAP